MLGKLGDMNLLMRERSSGSPGSVKSNMSDVGIPSTSWWLEEWKQHKFGRLRSVSVRLLPDEEGKAVQIFKDGGGC